MPISNDNQDYGKSDEKNKQQESLTPAGESKLTSDDLKGKKIDADLEMDTDKPIEQKK